MTILGGKRVLIVEDEPIVAMCLEDMLIDLGCEVVGPASRVQEGLTLAETEGLDAAILDVNLGADYSYAIADALSERGVPFAFATGYDRVDYSRGGESTLIQKPYKAERVGSVLETLIERKRCI